MLRLFSWLLCMLSCTGLAAEDLAAVDAVRELQRQAAESGHAEWGRWGTDTTKYSSWMSHSNRLIPVYTFGVTLEEVADANSVYRDADRLQQLYQRLPDQTVNNEAEYFDQTDIARLQRDAVAAGKKYIVLIVFDGMDWQTTHAAATYKAGHLSYNAGRGTGLMMQNYRGAVTDYGYFVASPYANGVKVDVDTQTLTSTGETFGGYNWLLGGARPWDVPGDLEYLIGRSTQSPHAYPDSAATATALCAGTKTYNASINVDPFGRQVTTVAHELQQQGFGIGVVTSVPISHATPACAYAHNVHRDDYQDLTRDLLGRPSVSHPEPLAGVDVLLGAGWGEQRESDASQGRNYVPGNRYLAAEDLHAIDVTSGGAYVVAQRTAGAGGKEVLETAAQQAVASQQRLFGFFGVRGGHLPYATADGNYDPTYNAVRSGGKLTIETYTEADVRENPTLAEMTSAALEVLASRGTGFWLMVEPGDVDFANHANNIDNSIGAVLSGDQAFAAVAQWAEANDAWDETAVIITADHGHLLVLDQPEVLVP